MQVFTRRGFLVCSGAAASASLGTALGAKKAFVASQPYFAGVNRALEALAGLGSPVAAEDVKALAVLTHSNDAASVGLAEKILDRYTLARISLEEDGFARAALGAAPRTLVERGWSLFLLRISNAVGKTDKLNIRLGTGFPTLPVFATSSAASRAGLSDTVRIEQNVAQNWLFAQLYDGAPMGPALSGAPVEYRVIQLYSRDRGQHGEVLSFYTSTERFAALPAFTASRAAPFYFRGVNIEFETLPSQDVLLGVKDSDGRGCVASLTIRDKIGRIYPLQAMRFAPDLRFQPHIYRADGESVRLPDGQYTIESWRGPEYLRGAQSARIDKDNGRIDVQLKRWIDPAQWGWYSGDPHIHAGGCSHYDVPTEGVSPETMIRHIRGEALSVGDVLSWGPSWYYQKQFFTGHAESPPASLEHPELQAANNTTLKPLATPEDSESVLRYDVEVSNFPSSHCGHLALLRLREQDYPGTKLIQDWPSWNLPILKWAKEQGALAGYAHCGVGMVVDSTEIPNYEPPPMDGPGAQEAFVDVTHGLVDFLSGCDTAPAAELNTWYHILNCGFRPAMLGETDFPCITDERPGNGRTYVRLDERPVGNVGYEAWIEQIRKGKVYCGDGRSHFLEFTVQGRGSGDADIELESAGSVEVAATVAARLEPEFKPENAPKRLIPGWGWHLEWARIGKTREVPVELIVNGVAVDQVRLLADGAPRPVRFKTAIVRSSWVALRILPSAQTHPVFIQVAGKPIRASKRSAQWCRACVDKLWQVRANFIREGERTAAAEAFDSARRAWDRIIDECDQA